MEWFFLMLLGWMGLKQKPLGELQANAQPAQPDALKWDRDIPFDPGDPTTFEEYQGQENAKALLQLVLDTAHINTHPKIMLVGPKGTGKTALARILARLYLAGCDELTGGEFHGKFGRYLELTPPMLPDKSRLDDFMRQIRLWDVNFLDEVHMLDRRLAETLLPALEDNVYPFPEGMKDLPDDYVMIGATTDVGLLPEPFQDRFQLIYLNPLTQEQLAAIVTMQPMTSDREAALEIARRSAGYAREVKRIYRAARDAAIQQGKQRVTMKDALRAFQLLDLDEHGLYAIERQILKILYSRPKHYKPLANGTVPKRYAQSETTLRSLTGLDENFYKQIEGKLLRLNFLTIGSGGRELTEHALHTYFA
jgi:Holliday junction DNA helicase RuvB